MDKTSSHPRLMNLGGIALLGAGIVSKFLGAIYRIPLTNILGAEGIGLYQLVFPIYALMITLSSSGIPTAISRLVAERHTLHDSVGIRGIVKTSAIMLTTLGTLFMGIMMLISSPLAHLQGEDALKISYFAIAPSILIVAASSVFKGYFQGMLNLVPAAVTQLVEQVVKMAVGLILASFFMRYGIVYAVTGAVLGLTSAEAVSFFIMLGIYLKRQHSKTNIHVYGFKRFGEDILRVSLPIALSGMVFPLMQVIDSLLIVNILRSNGISTSRATELYGILTGPVNTLINMPIVVTLALSIMIVPIISSSRIMRDASMVRSKCEMAIKLSYIVGVPAFFGMFVMAGTIMRVLYPSLTSGDIEIGAGLLRVSSVSVVLLAEVQIYTSLLEALDKSKVGMRALMVGALIKVALSVVLIKYMSIIGASLASILTYLVIVTIDSLYLRRYLGKMDSLFKSIAKIMLSGLIMAGVVTLGATFIPNIYASLLVAVLLGVAIYTLLMLLLKVMDEDELLSLPCGKLIAYLERKMRFWERYDD